MAGLPLPDIVSPVHVLAVEAGRHECVLDHLNGEGLLLQAHLALDEVLGETIG